MSKPTTHDTYASRYIQPCVPPPSNTPSGPTPSPPFADLQAALSVTADPPPPAPSAPAPSEQAAPVTLANALKRLADAREQVALAESEIAAVAAYLSGSN